MTTMMGILLILNGVFNVLVWPRFFKRVMEDPRAYDANGPTRFLRVHTVIVGGALLLAAFSIVLGILGILLPDIGWG